MGDLYTLPFSTDLKENQFLQLLDSIPGRIAYADVDLKLLFVNQAYAEWFGKAPKDLLGKQLADLCSKEELQSIDPHVQAALRGEKQRFVVTNNTTDNNTLEVVYTPNFLADERVCGITIFINDITHLNNVESKLQRKTYELQDYVDNATIGLHWVDANGIIIWANKAELNMLGYEAEEYIGKPISDFHTDPDAIKNILTRLSANETLNKHEAVLRHKDGSSRHVHISSNVLWENEQFIHTRCFTIDITNEKELLREQQESESRFRNVADHAPMLVWVSDENGNAAFINKTCLEFTGISKASDLDTASWAKHIHPEDRDNVMQIFETAFQNHGAYTFEARVKEASTGEYHWIFAKGVPRYNNNDRFGGFMVTAIDIEERKQTEKVIRESVGHINFLADTMPQKVWTALADGAVTYMNIPWVEYTGINLEEFRKAGWQIIVHPHDYEAYEKKWMHSIATGEPFENEHRYRSKSGDYRWHLTRSIPQHNSNGEIIMWVGTDTDIDDKKRTEEELILANKIAEYSLLKRDKALRELMETKKKVEEIMRVKEQFLSNMSHEIRTPMNAIVGFTDLILKTGLTAEQKQFTEAIKTSGENLLVIINDILDFSKLEAGAITFEKIEFKLSQVLATMTDLMLPKSIEKNIKLSVVIDKKIPDHLIGDPTRLNQVLLNLVGNAIKFTEKGEIQTTVDLVEDDGDTIGLKFSVRDTGIGIPFDKIMTIFEPFTQATSDTTRKYGGSGLGLSIVRQFVEKQGGTIGIDSTVGEGSTFSFRLTFGKNSNTPAPATALPDKSDDETFAVQGLNILLVEDNELNQILATKVLTNWKWNVELAENGKIAVEKIRQKDYDLVLMDIQLPEMDGYEATRIIRTKLPAPKSSVPIMAMTAHAMISEEKKCYEAGMDGYISKPFAPKMLYARIVGILKNMESPAPGLKK